MIDLSGKVALVTGASGGIGAASALMLARSGAGVVLAGRNLAQLEALKGELAATGGRAEVLPFDVTDEGEVKRAFAGLLKITGRLDYLIAAAGVMHDAPLAMMQAGKREEVLRVNVEGTIFCCQYGSRLIARQSEGAIVTIGSIVGERGAAGQSVYSASKAAITGLSRSLAKELAPSGIRVNCLAPGFIETGMTDVYSGDKKAEISERIGLQRLGSPQDVANVVLFLCSPMASYITGQVIGVDGGMTL